MLAYSGEGAPLSQMNWYILMQTLVCQRRWRWPCYSGMQKTVFWARNIILNKLQEHCVHNTYAMFFMLGCHKIFITHLCGITYIDTIYMQAVGPMTSLSSQARTSWLSGRGVWISIICNPLHSSWAASSGNCLQIRRQYLPQLVFIIHHTTG